MARWNAIAGIVMISGCAVMGGDEISYSHASHLVLGTTTCLTCHSPIEKAKTLAERTYIPGHDGCDNGDCHSVTDSAKCTVCHSNAKQALRSQASTRTLIFSHETHLERARGNCMKCHLDVPSATTTKESKIPPMAVCTESCHTETIEQLKCDQCHLDLAHYALEEIRLFAHGARFERRHGPDARSHRETCAQCHERQFCSDCHSTSQTVEASTKLVERAGRSFIHAEPYEALHATDARISGSRCETCHRPSFCESCHARQMVSTVEDLRAAPHPDGWLDPVSPEFHGFEARRSIFTCASCHDQGGQSICVRCHEVGGSGGNPHPVGFVPRTAPRDNRMCRTCHTSQ